MIKCPCCKSAKYIVRNGKTKNGNQRLFCKDEECGTSFLENYNEGFSDEEKFLGAILRESKLLTKIDVAEIMNCSVGGIYRWKSDKIKKKINRKKTSCKNLANSLFKKFPNKFSASLVSYVNDQINKL